ncbi:hypothetical protein FNU76_09470 [Chitinimonas arctica]|uniref:Uncharacterized protein n=1 Tax=Chitinimonas arctica TaxID=2594795 RepID=A0A516SEM1_9NEIS|nr:hypothetical protein [Chitinimonas arctica]QDQ26583.1 hypothetical protein FNU76_09470 [Chitinimonas arctica]
MSFGESIWTPFVWVVNFMGPIYWTVAITVLLFAWLFPKTLWVKCLGTILVVLVFGYLPITWGLHDYREKTKSAATAAAAKALYESRCKGAGEKIYRKVSGVDGIFLMKLRPEGVNFQDQFALNDPYGADFDGEAYPRSFLRGHYIYPFPLPLGWPPRTGYLYVDAIDKKDGLRYRYTGYRKADPAPFADPGSTIFISDKMLTKVTPPRYGVIYDDISTREDRKYWIAGSSLRVVDMETKEVIAERIGYMIDLGQGSNSGGRSPWGFAADTACPGFDRKPGRLEKYRGFSAQIYQTLDFVEKVLIPTGE